MEFQTSFSQIQLTLLLSSCFFIMAAVISNFYSKEKLIYISLFLAAFSAFSFGALLDPFLNLWDERYHALVAKNMSVHPLTPTLYDDPVLMHNYTGWYNSVIWIHKQPLFLWQMALSYKLFGSSEFALRLPSVILGSFLTLATFRCGRLLVNRDAGFFAAVLLITSFYLTELIAGRQSLDHNDVAFLSYISFSIWSLLEYRHSGQKKWIILIGLFSGLAILNKWLVGLLVYLGWFVLKVMEKNLKLSGYKDLLLALLITILVALPWQLYTFIRFPQEAAFIHRFNSRHFFEVLEGHGGDSWYHLRLLKAHYGNFAFVIIIPALIGFYFRIKNKKVFFSLMAMLVVTYMFFSIASTKMPSFTFIVAMIIFIAMGSFIELVQARVNSYFTRKWINRAVFLFIIIGLVAIRFDYEYYKRTHLDNDGKNVYSRALKYNKDVFTSLNLPGNAVLFNVTGTHFIEAMYYTSRPCYNYIPTEGQYSDLKKKGRIAAIFQSGEAMPDYLANDPEVIILNEKIEKVSSDK